MLKGKKVDLRAVETSDYPLLWRWMNDAEAMYFWGRPGNTVSLEEVERAERAESSRGTSRKYVIETHDGHPIGIIDYYDLEWQPRSAWVSILIADRDYWGGGYGTDAMRALLTYLFRQMDLHRVTLTLHESNARARRSYEKNGFKMEGTLRDWAYFDGHWVNGILMAVLETDFEQSEPAS